MLRISLPHRRIGGRSFSGSPQPRIVEFVLARLLSPTPRGCGGVGLAGGAGGAGCYGSGDLPTAVASPFRGSREGRLIVLGGAVRSRGPPQTASLRWRRDLSPGEALRGGLPAFSNGRPPLSAKALRSVAASRAFLIRPTIAVSHFSPGSFDSVAPSVRNSLRFAPLRAKQPPFATAVWRSPCVERRTSSVERRAWPYFQVSGGVGGGGGGGRQCVM